MTASPVPSVHSRRGRASTGSGPISTKTLPPKPTAWRDRAGEAYRLTDVLRPVGRGVVTARGERAGHRGDDRDPGPIRADTLERFDELGAAGIEGGAVKGTVTGQEAGEYSPRAGLGGERIDGVGITREHDRARAVDGSDDEPVVEALQRLGRLLRREPDREHPPLPACAVHDAAAVIDDADSVGEGQHAGPRRRRTPPPGCGRSRSQARFPTIAGARRGPPGA